MFTRTRSLVSRDSMEHHKQSDDGGQGQAEAAGTLQRRGAVAQIGVAARLVHAVSGGVGVATGKAHGCGLVALSFHKASLHLDIHEADCFPNTAEAVLSRVACDFAGDAKVP